MATGSAALTVLGTTIVAALAVGAAVGVHSLVGDPDDGPGTDIAMSDDFCTLMDEMMTFADEKSDAVTIASVQLYGINGEPASLDDIHAWGETILELAVGAESYMRHAAEVVSDPIIAQAFETSADDIEIELERPARAAIDAVAADTYQDGMSWEDMSAEDQAILAEADSAEEAISAYVLSECGIDLSGGSSTSGVEASVKTDVSTLGKEIATAFVYWSEGDPLPEVSLSDGEYGVATSSVIDGGTSVSTIHFSSESSDPAIVEQAIVSSVDWCVSVTDNAAASPTTYSYSAQLGLMEGTCAALAGG